MGRPKAELRGYPLMIALFTMQDKMEWSNDQYAEKSGLPSNKIGRLRRGIQEPSLHDIIQLMDPFGLRLRFERVPAPVSNDESSDD